MNWSLIDLILPLTIVRAIIVYHFNLFKKAILFTRVLLIHDTIFVNTIVDMPRIFWGHPRSVNANVTSHIVCNIYLCMRTSVSNMFEYWPTSYDGNRSHDVIRNVRSTWLLMNFVFPVVFTWIIWINKSWVSIPRCFPQIFSNIIPSFISLLSWVKVISEIVD